MPLDSANNGYNPTPQLQQVLASPDIHQTQQRLDVNSKSYQLASQLGALSPEVDKIGDRVIASDKENAEALVNSMTPDQLQQKYKDNPLSVTGSPIFNATVSKFNARNIADQDQNSILQKVHEGFFQSDPESTKYDANDQLNPNWKDGNQHLQDAIAAQRALSLTNNTDRFAVQGYDTNYHQFITAATQSNSTYLAEQHLEYAAGVLGAAATNVSNKVQTPEELTASLASVFANTSLKGGELMPPKARTSVYDSLLQKAAYSGDPTKVQAILDVPLDNGQTIANVIGKDGFGEIKAGKFLHQAQQVFEQNQRKNEVAQRQAAVAKAADNLTSAADEAVRTGTASSFRSRETLPTMEGTKTVDTSDTLYDAQVRLVQGMNPDQRQASFNGNHIIDKDVQKVIAAGVTSDVDNSSTDLVTGKPKPAGQVSQKYLDAYSAYMKLRTGSNGASVAAEYTPPELMKKFDALTSLVGAGWDINTASTTMAMADGNEVKMGEYKKEANKIVTSMDAGFFARVFQGQDPLTGNVEKAKADMASVIAYQVAAGMDKTKILANAEKYIPENYVNVQGSLIPRNNIPATGLESQIDGGATSLMNAFNDEVKVKIGAAQGINPDEITLMPTYNGSAFHWMAKGQLLAYQGKAFTQTQDDYREWVDKNFENVRADLAYEPARTALKNSFSAKATTSPLETMGNSYESIGGDHNNPLSTEQQYLTSRSGFRELTQAGLATPTSNFTTAKGATPSLADLFTSKDPHHIALSTAFNPSYTDHTVLNKAAFEDRQVLRDKQIAFARTQLRGGASWTDSGAKVPYSNLPDLKGMQVDPRSQDTGAWDKRPDGSAKGNGFLGLLKRPDGGVSSEISISTDAVGGKDFPLLVPTLTRQEVEKVLSLDPHSKDFVDKLPKGVVDKAQSFAARRLREGRPLFATPSESPSFDGGK